MANKQENEECLCDAEEFFKKYKEKLNELINKTDEQLPVQQKERALSAPVKQMSRTTTRESVKKSRAEISNFRSETSGVIKSATKIIKHKRSAYFMTDTPQGSKISVNMKQEEAELKIENLDTVKSKITKDDDDEDGNIRRTVFLDTLSDDSLDGIDPALSTDDREYWSHLDDIFTLLREGNAFPSYVALTVGIDLNKTYSDVDAIANDETLKIKSKYRKLTFMKMKLNTTLEREKVEIKAMLKPIQTEIWRQAKNVQTKDSINPLLVENKKNLNEIWTSLVANDHKIQYIDKTLDELKEPTSKRSGISFAKSISGYPTASTIFALQKARRRPTGFVYSDLDINTKLVPFSQMDADIEKLLATPRKLSILTGERTHELREVRSETIEAIKNLLHTPKLSTLTSSLKKTQMTMDNKHSTLTHSTLTSSLKKTQISIDKPKDDDESSDSSSSLDSLTLLSNHFSAFLLKTIGSTDANPYDLLLDYLKKIINDLVTVEEFEDFEEYPKLDKDKETEPESEVMPEQELTLRETTESVEEEQEVTKQKSIQFEFISDSMKFALFYVKDKNICQLFKYMGAKLLASTPENPIEFLIDVLDQCYQYRNGRCGPPLLFERQHVESLYKTLDPMNFGEIDIKQYYEALYTLGLTEYKRKEFSFSNTKISKECFMHDIMQLLKQQFDEMIRMPNYTFSSTTSNFSSYKFCQE